MITITIAVIVFVLLLILVLLASLIAIALKVVGRNNHPAASTPPAGAPTPGRTPPPSPPNEWRGKKKWYLSGAVVLYLVAIIAYLFLPSHELPVQSVVWLFALLALVMSAFLPFWPGVSIFLGVIVCAGIMLSGVQGSGLAPGAGSAGSATTATTYFNPSPTPLPTSASVTVSKKDGWKPLGPIICTNGVAQGINYSPDNAVAEVMTADGDIHKVGRNYDNDVWHTRQTYGCEQQTWMARVIGESESSTATVTVLWANK